MNISTLLITTNHTNRQHLFKNTINSLEKAGISNISNEKIISIDIFEEYPFDIHLYDEYKNNGWTIIADKCTGYRGMINNINRGLQKCTNELIFYSEDDVIINKIPKNINTIFSYITRNNKHIGFICYNTHIHEYTFQPPNIIKEQYIHNLNNYITIAEEVFLLKDEIIKDEYYLNFPVAIYRRNLYEKILNYSINNYKNIGLEPGLSKAWFELGINNEYDVCVYLKNELHDISNITYTELHKNANMNFRDNDINLRHPSINERLNTLF